MGVDIIKMARIVAPVVCLLLSCLLKPARAEIDLEDCREDEYACYVQSGHVAVNNAEYEDAFEWFTLAAQDEYPQGLDMVGISYQQGQGVEKDDEKAFEYYKKAAETGYDQGLFHLGAAYSAGIGVEEDQRLALKAWLEAAQLGHASSAYNIGLRYQAGTAPLEENKKAAMQFFHLAAEGGHLGAMFNMGVFLTFTKGNQQNHTVGCKWFQNVSETGQMPQYANDATVARAMVNLAMCYFTGEGPMHAGTSCSL